MSSKAELKKAIEDYFADQSRAQSETKETMLEFGELMLMMADSLEGDE